MYGYTMPLNIKDPETERLAREVAVLTGESKTGAIRTALRERKARLALQRGSGSRAQALTTWLESDVWPLIPADLRGKGISQDEQDDILGYGPRLP
jgi:antitoxin VapB